MAVTTVGQISVSDTGVPGDLIAARDDVQYGGLLLPATVGAELINWRDLPDTAVSDTSRPQAHGAYAGDIFAESIAVTLTYRLLNPPLVAEADRDAMVRLIERNLPLDSVERPLVVNDGDLTYRMARVLQRHVPRGQNYRFDKRLECSVQFLCADPRRYALAATSVPITLGSSSGGLTYPLTYPIVYGTSVGGSRALTNNGGTPTPPLVTFTGPLVNPALSSDQGWRMAFQIMLAAGETLVVDTAQGTSLLNGATDRLYTIDPTSSPLDRCLLRSGVTTVSFGASSGSGTATVVYRDAYL